MGLEVKLHVVFLGNARYACSSANPCKCLSADLSDHYDFLWYTIDETYTNAFSIFSLLLPFLYYFTFLCFSSTSPPTLSLNLSSAHQKQYLHFVKLCNTHTASIGHIYRLFSIQICHVFRKISEDLPIFLFFFIF